ncbi:MAG: NUDIX hydrolase [Bacillota bacterium]
MQEFEDLDERTVATETIYQGNILTLRKDRVKLPDGNFSQREIVEHSGGVAILAVTPENRVVMVEQYRKPAETTLLEVPAGKLEPDESPENSALRELREETGYRAGDLKKLVSFYTSPGYSDEVLHLYQATDLQQVGRRPDPGEFLRVKELKAEQISAFMKNGRIGDSKTVIALLWFLRGGSCC